MSTNQDTPSEHTRPDFALQLLLRLQRRDNPHENPEYQVITAAVRELQRLYKMEMFVISYFETDNEKARRTSLGMVRSFLRPGAIETGNPQSEPPATERGAFMAKHGLGEEDMINDISPIPDHNV